MGKQEILPPVRRTLPAPRPTNPVVAPPPRFNPGGIIESHLTRWEANRHARTTKAVAARTHAETELFDAQTQAVEAYVKRQRAGALLQELPEVLATDRQRRRWERQEELREIEHRMAVKEAHRRAEFAHADAALVDAQQALQAQREYGSITYELAWKKKHCEMLDVELSAAERRAILRDHLGMQQPAGGDLPPDDDRMLDALYEARAQLVANGLDTSRVDAAIERQTAKRR